MKRKKKNDIERVTGRNRPQKTVKSRALVRGWGVWVAVENKRTREKPVGGIAWAKTRPLEARGDPHESAGQAFLFRLFRSMGHPGNNRVRNGLPPNGRACTSLRARQGWSSLMQGNEVPYSIHASGISKYTGRISTSSEEEFIKASAPFEYISVSNQFFPSCLRF